MRHGGLWTGLILAACTPATLHADDVFLTIGGGYNPSGNQVSLEKNALLFQRILAETYPAEVRHDIFFADGDAQNRDLQFVDPNLEIPRPNELLAEIFGQSDEIDYQYRNHQVPGVSGPTARDNIERWFKETGSTLGSGDRLFIYVTAHGGRSPDKDHPHDTTLLLWNRQPLRVHDLAAWLRYVPHHVPVAMVMVQCYSGGFAYSVYDDGHADSGLADADRCGFYATVHDRVAAGCTPDIDEANYHEYSTSFFEALRGKTRFDEPIARPDYDGDGRTSLSEAHAYVVLTSTTIDIPVCTSDEYLRAISAPEEPPQDEPRRRGQRNREATPQEEPANESSTDDAADTTENPGDNADPGSGDAPLLTADSPYGELLALATPAQQAVLEGLSAELEVSGDQRAAAARARAEEFEKERKQVEDERNKLKREYDQIREEIKQRLLARWPELNNRWHPVTSQILTQDAGELLALVESHPRFARLNELAPQLDDLADSKLDFERLWVKCRRLERTLETVALAANLPLTATDDEIAGYQRLVAAEGAFFGPQADDSQTFEPSAPTGSP